MSGTEHDGSGSTASEPGARPRPQYGEYATPEEVAAITGRRPEEAEPVRTHPGTDVPVVEQSPYGERTGTGPSGPTSRTDPSGPPAATDHAPLPPAPHLDHPAPAAADRLPGRPVPRFRLDRPIAWGLLAAAVVSFLLSAPQYLNWATTLRASFEQLRPFGYGEFGAAGVANALGPWVGTTHLLLLLVTIGLTLAAGRRRRTIFWIPLVGYAVWALAQSVFVLAVLLQDPGYRAMMVSLTGS